MQYKKLREIADVFTGARLSRYNTFNTKNQPVIKKIYANNQLEYKNEEISVELNKKFYTNKGDILVQLAQPNTITKINQEGLIVPMFYGIIRTKPGYDSNYIYYILKNDMLSRYQNILTEGSVIQTIRTNYLKELQIPIIDKEKQIKIGELLDLINIKKDLHRQLIEIDEKIEKTILKDYIKRND